VTQQAVPFRSVPPHAAVELALREADRLRVQLHTELTGPPATHIVLLSDGRKNVGREVDGR
jgi:hypothetical protein